ncbi:MAG: hypothetical protein K2X66_08025, partial [Cyanobacteria bacterium]|nr:hypothetical protein [Cyanobacteriota bacterium]
MNHSMDAAYLRNGRNFNNALEYYPTRENDDSEYTDQDIADALSAIGMDKSQLPQPKEVNTYLSALSPGGLKSFTPSSDTPLVLPPVPQPFRSQSRNMGSSSGGSVFRAPFENQIVPQREGLNLAQAQVKQQPHLKALTHLKALAGPDAVAADPPPVKLPQIPPPPPPEPEKQAPGNPPISQTQVMEQVFQQLSQELGQAEKEFSTTKSKQGWLGSSWDWVKNTVGASPKGKSWWNPSRWWGSVVNSDEGSKSTGKGIESLKIGLQGLQASLKAGNLEEFKEKYTQLTGKPFDMEAIQGNLTSGKGLLNENEKIQGVKHYQESQKAGVDIIADIGSGLVAFFGYTLAVGGVIAAPFTLGSSLAVTAWGVGVAAAGGAVTKTLIKASDAWSGGQEYDSLGSDLLTGGFSGVLAPLSAGVGGSVAKQVGNQA